MTATTAPAEAQVSGAGRGSALGRIALVGLLAALPVLWPLLHGQVPGHPGSDLADHVQGAWWFGGELLAGRLPWRLDHVLHPDGGVLWYPDPIGALLALPFRAAGPFASFTVALLLQCLANAAAAWALGRRVTGTSEGGFLAACVVGPSAYVAGLLHSGLSEYLGLWPLVLFVLAAHDWVARGRRPWAPPLLLALATLQAPYYGVFAGLYAGCLLLPGGEVGLRTRLRRVLGMGIPGALLALPVLLAVQASLLHPDAAVQAATAPGWTQHAPPGTDLLGFVAPFSYYHPDTPALGNPGILHVHHLGWIALGLAVLGIRDRRAAPFRWAAVAWFVLALGPSLVVGHTDAGIPLPGRLLWLPGSPFTWVHHPYRMVALTLPLLAALAALGASRLGLRALLLGPLIAVEALLLSPAPFPLVGTETTVPDIYADLPEGAVLDLPPDLRGPNRSYVWWSLAHGRPVPYGVNHLIADPVAEDPELSDLLGRLRLAPRRWNRDVPPSGTWPDPVDHGGLEGLGFGTVVLHAQWLDERERASLEGWLRARLGSPVAEEDGRIRWSVPRSVNRREP